MAPKHPYSLVALFLLFAFAQLGCKKPGDVLDQLNTPPGPFSVTVTLRTESSAKIEWTRSDDPDGDSVRYMISLDGVRIDSNLFDLQYEFTNLIDSKEYKGFVIARDKHGDTSRASFILPPFEGWLFGRTGSGFSCVSISTGSIKWSMNPNNTGFMTPILLNDTVFTIDAVGELFALDYKTGKVFWRKKPPINQAYPIQVWSSPAYENGKVVVLVESDSLAVSAFRSSDGALLWTYKNKTIVQTSVTIANNIAYFTDNGHTLYALDMADGHVKWTYNTNVNYDNISGPTVAGNLVYFGSSFGNRLYALNATTGAFVWRYSAAASIDPAPRVENGVLYIASQDGQAYAFNALNGHVIWQTSIGGYAYSNPSIDDKNVYYGFNLKYLVAIRKSDGKGLWSVDIKPPFTQNADFISANGRVYVPGLYELFQIQTSDGKSLPSIPIRVSSFILYINKKVYYPSSSGMLQ